VEYFRKLRNSRNLKYKGWSTSGSYGTQKNLIYFRELGNSWNLKYKGWSTSGSWGTHETFKTKLGV